MVQCLREAILLQTFTYIPLKKSREGVIVIEIEHLYVEIVSIKIMQKKIQTASFGLETVIGWAKHIWAVGGRGVGGIFFSR